MSSRDILHLPIGDEADVEEKISSGPRTPTEDKLAQRTKALIQSDARFHAIFENAAVGIILVSLERRFLAFNAVTEEILGYGFREIQDVDPRMLALPEDRSIDNELF